MTALFAHLMKQYHLVVDLKANQNFRDWMVESSKLYPPTKEADDYIE